MAKISPVSIKYLIHAKFTSEGALEKPDVIGAIFGQTEGLLGSELEMRELQKEGKIGRIEVELERNGKNTTGEIKIPTALDQSETTLIAAAIETIERIGPSDAKIEVERIEDVRGSKRDYIIERAKALMQNISGTTNSREISSDVKESVRMAKLQEYGDEKLPCGDLSGNEVIVVEGRADVVNLIRNNVNNVIGMNGTKLPDAIRKLGMEKELTLFVDGDHGGKLIIQNVTDNANIKYIAVAPDGKEVEELAGKEILAQLRKKVSVSEFLSKSKGRFDSGRNSFSSFKGNYGDRDSRDRGDYRERYDNRERTYDNREREEIGKKPESSGKTELTPENKEKLKEIARAYDNSKKAAILNNNFEVVKEVSAKMVTGVLRRTQGNILAIVIDGTATATLIESAKQANCYTIVAKNFSATDPQMNLLSL